MRGRLLIALGLAGGLALALLAALGLFDSPGAYAAPTAVVRYVLDDGGVDTGDCTSAAAPCQSVVYALGEAQSGDTIRVANRFSAAVYVGALTIDRSVTLEGGWAAVWHPMGFFLWFRPSPCEAFRTTLDAAGTGRVITIVGNITPTIDCFTITGGDAAGLGGDPGTTVDNDAGGGIYSQNAAPIITNNVITANFGCSACPVSYGRGGGVYLINAPATAIISGNLIAYNVADDGTWGQGGGIMLRDSNAQVLSNTIEHNRAGYSSGYGGGIAVRNGSPTIADNDFLSNVAGQSVNGLGGGIFVWTDGSATIERNLVQSNRALSGPGDPLLVSRGGGICFTGDPSASALIRDNTLRYNTASPMGPYGQGGGMYLSALDGAAVVSGNTLEENVAGFNEDGDGGGIYVAESEVTIADNHLFDNAATWSGSFGEGGGVLVDGGAVLLQGNVITRNAAAFFPGFPASAEGHGGGIAILGGDTVVQDNWIADNAGTNSDERGLGGGIYVTTATVQIVGNTIAENHAGILDEGRGGGLAVFSSQGSVEGNEITGNEATSDTVGVGGGIYIYSGTLQVVANTIDHNLASRAGPFASGGGVYLGETRTWLDRNVVVDNVAHLGADGRGGGVRIGLCPVFTLTNNIVARNDASGRGSGVAIQASTGQLVHNTIAENVAGDGVGVRVDSGSVVTLINNIVVSQVVGIENTDPGSTVNADTTLFEANGADFSANVTSSNEVPGPALLLPNYHLGAGSSAINAGTPVGWVTHDVDGEARPYGGAPDVGADEFTCLARVGGTDYSVIQDAIDAATPGQTVMVAEGICYENLRVDRTLTLQGGWTPSFTSRHADPATVSTIDGLGHGRVIHVGVVGAPPVSATIDGFTITGGDATGLGNDEFPGYDAGGGIYSWGADTTVANCIVRDNTAGTASQAIGGGMCFLTCEATLTGNVVQDNVGSINNYGFGGGVAIIRGFGTIVSNTVQDNLASETSGGYGGGLFLELGAGLHALQGNTVLRNVAGPGATGRGGGISIYQAAVNMDGDVVEGNAANAPGHDGFGGGVSVEASSAVTMSDVVMQDNLALGDTPTSIDGWGGGVYVDASTLTLGEATVISNTAQLGGGVHARESTVALTGSSFSDNVASSGGGAFLYMTNGANVAGNQFADNAAVAYGGGVYLQASYGVALTGNTFTGNDVSGDGGGAYILFSEDCVFSYNTALANQDSGVDFYGCENGLLDNNVIADNDEGVAITGHTVRLRHNTIARNGARGVGVYGYWAADGMAVMTNTILVSHSVGITVASGSVAVLEATLWGDGIWSNGAKWLGPVVDGAISFLGNPGFVDPVGGDYHIYAASDAIDAGIDAGVSDDIDGNPRPLALGYDIGADEVYLSYLPLALRDYP